MLLLDISLRFATITILLVTAALAFRDARHILQGKLAVALCICLASMLANTMPNALEPPFAWQAIAWFVHIPNTILLWLFGLSLFVDDFRLKRVHWGILLSSFVILCSLQAKLMTGSGPPFLVLVVINRALGLGVLIHLFWTTIRGYRDDLVESRRRTRLWFMLAASIAALVIVGGETLQFLVSGPSPDPEWFKLARVVIILPIAAFGLHWFARLQPEQFLFEPVRTTEVSAPAIDPKDTATHTRLVAAMQEEFLYREHGLGIGDLAAKLNVPEHQLRALINKGLGYRNFAAFLNQYRLAEAKTALADPEQARTPILTIAMDVGYASLATFNRAFKSEEGQTPSQYRTEALAKAAQS